MFRVPLLAGLLLGACAHRAEAAWDLTLACELAGPGTDGVEVRLDVPGCLDEPIGHLRLPAGASGRHLLVDGQEPGFEALLRCGREAGRVTLWVLPDGGSGCGHRLPLELPLQATRFELSLTDSLRIATSDHGSRIGARVRVEAQ